MSKNLCCDLVLSVLAEQRKHLFYFGLKKPAAGESVETHHRLVWSMLSELILHLIIIKRPAFETPFALPFGGSPNSVRRGANAA